MTIGEYNHLVRTLKPGMLVQAQDLPDCIAHGYLEKTNEKMWLDTQNYIYIVIEIQNHGHTVVCAHAEPGCDCYTFRVSPHYLKIVEDK